MEGGKNQLGPNVGAVDIIHNQRVARGGTTPLHLTSSSPSLPLSWFPWLSLDSLSLCRPTRRSDRRTGRAETGSDSAALITAAVETGIIEIPG